VLPRHREDAAAPGGAGGLSLRSIRCRLASTRRCTRRRTSGSEIAKTKAAVEAAEEAEARREEAERKEALKGSLESQVAEQQRRRAEELARGRPRPRRSWP